MKQRTSIKDIQELFPQFTFKNSGHFYWSPLEQVIYYNDSDISESASWSLLHELSHAVLGHTTYKTDLELLIMESEAWEQAKEITQTHDISIRISDDHIEDCLDTYRDWLHARSTCPTCALVGIQTSAATYTCLNCRQKWKISPSRFKRPYRMCLQ